MSKKYLTIEEYNDKYAAAPRHVDRSLKKGESCLDNPLYDGNFPTNSGGGFYDADACAQACLSGLEDADREIVSTVEQDGGVLHSTKPMAYAAADRGDSGADSPRAKKPAARGLGILGAMLMFICFGVAIFFSAMLADGLSLGHLVGKTKRLKIAGADYYCVQMGAFALKPDAEEKAEETRLKGGGGYIINSGGLYTVIASVYRSERDAENVIASLTAAGHTVGKFVLTVPDVMFDMDINDNQKQALTQALAVFGGTYDLLYQLSLSLDLGEKKSDAVKREILAHDKTVDTVSAAFSDATQNLSDLFFVRIKAELAALSQELDILSALDLENEALSVKIKYGFTKILSSYRSMLLELK